MDAAGNAASGKPAVVALPPPAREVLERIVRLACRTLDLASATVLVRWEADGELVPVGDHRAPGAGPEASLTGPTLERALADGTAAAGPLRAAAPIAWGGVVRGALAGVVAGGTRRFGRADLDALSELAELAGATLEEAERRARLEEVVDAGVAALVRAVDMRDDYTGRHSESVAELARAVGERLGIAGSDLWLLGLAARLHDVGKIGVPDAVLNKPGPLDSAEWALMREHAATGAEMIARVPGLGAVAPLVRAHHERWDGGGYPDGIAGEKIPIASRVIAACDAFQAMVAVRPYRPALSLDEAVCELTAGSGSQFDPAVVAALRHGTATAPPRLAAR
jgi:hypothetical protein